MIQNINYLCLSSLLWTPFSFGLTYQWPYTAQVDVEVTGPTSATYTQHIFIANVTDPSIEDHTTLQSVVSQKLGAYGSKVSFYSYHRHNNPSPNDSRPLVTAVPLMAESAKMTFKDFAQLITTRFGRGTRKVTHFGSKNGNECVGTTLGFEAAPQTYFDIWQMRTWNGGVTSAIDSCIGTPPVNEWCALITPQLTLDYDKMNIANAEGARVRGVVAVECTTGMKYTLRLRSPQGIALSNGMTANLLANNLPLNSALSGNPGRNTVSITSILSGTPRSTGSFEGSGVLFVSYP